MKIVDERKKEFTRFEDVKIGEVFKYEGSYLMKIQDLFSIPDANEEDEDNVYNAIGLVSGLPFEIGGYMMVDLLDCQLVIK